MKIAILHGPNLDRLGKREPEIYGRAMLKDLEKLIRTEARRLGFSTVFFLVGPRGCTDRPDPRADRPGRRRLHRQFRCLLAHQHRPVRRPQGLRAARRRGAHIGYQKTRTIPPEIHDRGCLRGDGLGPGFPELHRGAAAARESIGAPLAWWRLLNRSSATSQARGRHG